MARVLIVIPARYGSQRFPAKVLADLAGKPMIQWVWERAKQARKADEVVIATDDTRVEKAALEFGANGLMVPHCRSAAEARHWVGWAKFPPLGRRGFDGAGADADWALADPIENLKHANEETFLLLQMILHARTKV